MNPSDFGQICISPLNEYYGSSIFKFGGKTVTGIKGRKPEKQLQVYCPKIQPCSLK